ncbi:MAG: ribosome biogenesis GTPase YlqF [Betaproteobacteria bacterium]|nr:ribosome biogenesis GTPase YlqF [Betaproteobacteria bacterium]
MSIQWFPGHMALAREKAAETMARTDVVIEVVDARLPQASANPMIAELSAHRQRPRLRVLNKADLADPAATREWLAAMPARKDFRAVALSCRNAGDAAKVIALCQALAPHRNDGTKPLRMMIMGIPNAGKSTLMNALVRRKVAKVGDEPAVTKAQQSLSMGPRMTLTDTPGLLWPKIVHPSDGLMLAASHAVGTNAVMEEEVAAFLAELLKRRYPSALKSRYGFDPAELDVHAMMEAIARRRGCQLRGGGLDLEKASLILLHDYRAGALGRISLETPASRAAMIAAAAQEAADTTGPDPAPSPG